MILYLQMLRHYIEYQIHKLNRDYHNRLEYKLLLIQLNAEKTFKTMKELETKVS